MQSQAPGFGGSNQSTTSSSHGVSDSHSDLNNHECASQWGQDWFGNSGDVDTSGGPDGELYGLQKGKGAKGKGVVSMVFAICYNCGKTAKVGQLERDGQMARVGILQAKVGSNKGQQE